jgi:hypothetical protein
MQPHAHGNSKRTQRCQILISTACAEKLKRNAEDKTGEAMKLLNEKYEFCSMKLAELQRQCDLRTTEIKDAMTKGQKEKAKLILKRKKIIEKQMVAVQNVRTALLQFCAPASMYTKRLSVASPVSSGCPFPWVRCLEGPLLLLFSHASTFSRVATVATLELEPIASKRVLQGV